MPADFKEMLHMHTNTHRCAHTHHHTLKHAHPNQPTRHTLTQAHICIAHSHKNVWKLNPFGKSLRVGKLQCREGLRTVKSLQQIINLENKSLEKKRNDLKKDANLTLPWRIFDMFEFKWSNNNKTNTFKIVK